MKYLKRFNESISIYDPKWENLLPESLTVLKGQDHGIDRFVYKRGNIMLNPNMNQISYDINQWTAPDTFEIDIYTVKDALKDSHTDLTTIVKSGTFDYDRNTGEYIKNLRLDVDITFGDMMSSEFTISKDGVSEYQGTSYGSKFDPTNTLFAIEDDGLEQLVDFFNRFNIVELSLEDFDFLRNK
jgi:hypothetical protein